MRHTGNIIELGLFIWLMVWVFSEPSIPTYTGDTKTQAVYDVDNCIDEVLDEHPYLERYGVTGC